MQPPLALRQAAKDRFWFYRPEWYEGAWSPVYVGHDEYSRRTLMLGWPFTGRIVIALGYCGDAECYAESLRMRDEEENEA
jgi:hypothetical protein